MEDTGRKKRRKWLKQTANLALGVILGFICFLFSSQETQAINTQITFQGKLTNASGNTVSDGTYYLKLTIYDAATGGTCQYTASSTCAAVTSTAVTVTNGLFSVNLGDTSASLAALSNSLFNNSALYLGVTVCSGPSTGCDSEMTPRKRLTAAPYAFNADYLGGVTTSTAGGNFSYIPATDSSGNLKVSGSFYSATTTAGQVGFGTSTVPSGIKTFIESTTASDKLLVIRGNSSQTGNLTEWQTSTGKPLSYLDSNAELYLGGGTATSTFTSSTLAMGKASGYNLGKFYLDSSGNVSASGTLTVWGGVSTSSTIVSSTSFTFAKGTGYNSGLFNIDSSGNTSASGTFRVFGSLAMGASPSGNAQLYLNASSTTAVPLLIQGAANQAVDLFRVTDSNSNKVFYLDPSGDVFASGTLQVTGSMLTYGNVTSTGILYATNGLISSASSTFSNDLYVAGNLDIGAEGSGISQLYIKATSTTAKPLVIRANANQSDTAYLTEWQDASGNAIGFFASSTGENPMATLMVGNSTRPGIIAAGDFGGLYSFDPNDQTLASFGSINLDPNGALFEGGLQLTNYLTYNVTTTLTASTFKFAAATDYDGGKFSLDSSGNASASGSLYTFGNVTSTGILYATNGLISSASSTFSNDLYVAGNLDIGAEGSGISQLYLKASSTTAKPLVIRANANQDSSAYLTEWQDSNGALIGYFSSSTSGNANTSNLAIGNGSRTGQIVLDHEGQLLAHDSGSVVSARFGVIYSSSVGGNEGALILTDANTHNINTTLSASYFKFAATTDYDGGKFYLDSLGNASASGTLRLFGSTTNAGLKVTATNSTTTFTSYVSGEGAGAFVFDTTSTALSIASSSILLSVRNNGTPVFSVDTSGAVTATGTINANSTSPGPGDVAEYVNLVPGESAGPGDVLVVDPANSNRYKKSSSAYSSNVAGVISGTGAFIIGAAGENRVPLALAGLVKVKVTDENGSIKAGDYLVSASQPGYAMKYGATSGQSAGLVGMALEPLAEGDGVITIMVNKGLIAGAPASSPTLNVSQNQAGELVQSGDLNIAGYNILNVKSIVGKENKWQIDEEGYLIVKVTTAEGEKNLYGLQSGAGKEMVLSGSSQLEDGIKRIVFDLIDQAVIDPAAPIKVSVTLTSDAKGVFVSDKSGQGFTVKELNNGQSNASFDWVVIAKRRSQDVTNAPTAVGAANDTNVAPVVEEAVATSTVETASAPSVIETNEPVFLPVESASSTVEIIPIEPVASSSSTASE